MDLSTVMVNVARRAVQLTALESRIREERFSGMNNHDFLLFWEMGVEGESENETLSVAGEHHGRLLLVTAGNVSIRRGGEAVRRCGVGDFIGEMSLLSDRPASADVIAEGEVTYREWTHERINGLARSEPNLSASIRAALASYLTRKLADDRELLGRENPARAMRATRGRRV